MESKPPSFMRFAVVAGHKGRGRDLQIIIIIFVTARPRCSLAVWLSRCLDTDWINNFNFPFILEATCWRSSRSKHVTYRGQVSIFICYTSSLCYKANQLIALLLLVTRSSGCDQW